MAATPGDKALYRRLRHNGLSHKQAVALSATEVSEDFAGSEVDISGLQSAATAATDAELLAEVTARATALLLKQDASTAATDLELTAETAARVAALLLKQDAATAATDTELAAETTARTTALALKQDASTAATDAELAAALVGLAAPENMYAVGKLYGCYTSMQGSFSSAAPANNRMYLTPFWLPVGGTFDGLTVVMSSTPDGNHTNAVLRMGLRKGPNAQTHVLECTAPLAVNTGSAFDTKVCPFASTALPAGLYWVAMLPQGSAAYPSIRTMVTQQSRWIGYGTSGTEASQTNSVLYKDQPGGGALPTGSITHDGITSNPWHHHLRAA